MHRKLLFLIGFAGTALIVFLILPEQFDSGLFWASLADAHPAWLVAAIGATFLGYALRALRWQWLLQPLKHVKFGSLMNSTVLGFAAIYILGRPGEIVRPVWTARQEDIPTMATIASIIVERVFDLLMLVLFFIGASIWVDLPESTRSALGGLGTPWQLLTLAALTLVGFVLMHRYSHAVARLVPFKRFRSLAETFARGLAGTSGPRSIATIGLCSLLLWCVNALQFWLMLEALDLNRSVSAAVLTLVLTALGSIAQVPGIGGGFQAGFILAVTTILGAPAEVAVAASLIVWFVATVPTVIAAAGYGVWKGISLRDLRVDRSSLPAA